MNEMCYYCHNLTNVESLRNWNPIECTDAFFYTNVNYEVFENWDVKPEIKKKTYVPEANDPLESLRLHIRVNKSDIRDLDWCKDLDIDFSKVTDLSYLFQDCLFLENIDGIKDWNVSNVKSFKGMFKDCGYLRNCNGLKEWNVGNAEDMSQMFNGCRLESVEFMEGWNLKKVKTMERMFYGCKFDKGDIMKLNIEKNTNIHCIGHEPCLKYATVRTLELLTPYLRLERFDKVLLKILKQKKKLEFMKNEQTRKKAQEKLERFQAEASKIQYSYGYRIDRAKRTIRHQEYEIAEIQVKKDLVDGFMK